MLSVNKKIVFVAMPFTPELEDLWEFGILETISSLGFECLRADQMIDPGFIMNQVFELIARADIVIGEMTGRNHNVFYEIGYAHALGIPTILLAKSKDDLQAFDTQGFRHFFHDGAIKRVRQILRDTLPNLSTHAEVWPKVPNGKVIYEWPSSGFNPPDFRWALQSHDENSPIDENGGQSIVRLDQIGNSILITNTDKYWNHHSGHSIMCLIGKTDTLAPGDLVVLLLSGRTTDKLHLSLIGDGGWLNENRERWICSWKDVTLKTDIISSWSTWTIKATVRPTDSNYNPSERGTTIYIISSVGTGMAYYKKIQLVHVPNKHL